MADLKISQLTGVTTPLAGTEVAPVVQSGTTKKATVLDFTNGIPITPQKVNSGAYEISSSAVVTESGTSRTLSAADNGKVIYCTSGSAITINTASGLGAGFSCTMIQGGAGQITVAQGSSTTLASYSAFYKSAGQYAAMTLVCPVANTFILAGNTTA